MIELKNITKIYKTKGGEPVRALDDVSIVLPDKGLVFILGKSGCGKSTLLNIAGGLDKPTSGEIVVKGRSSKNFSQSDFDSYRNTYVGFIFQEYNVMPEFSVKENVTLATELQGKRPKDGDLQGVLGDVELGGLEKRKPLTLSGGQKQRVAIARALVKDPQIILADEPTGALDSNTGKAVLDLLKRLSENKLVVVVSHDRDFANQYADRIIELHDGRVISDMTFVHDEDDGSGMAVVGDKVHVTRDVDGEMLAQLNALLREKKTVTLILEGEGTTVHGGHFAETVPEEVHTAPYDDKPLIRSKFPLKYAARMGASGLKTKRFRLVMTVILSTLALTAFGFMLTLMTFDRNTALRNSLADGGQTELGVANYHVTTEIVPIVNMEYQHTRQELSDEERVKAFEKLTGLEFMKIQTFSHRDGAFSGSSPVFRFTYSSDYDYYSPTAFCGFAVTDEQQLSRFGAEIIYGRMPLNSNEIAVSDLVIEALYNSSATDTSGNKLMRHAGDMPIGKKIHIGDSSVPAVEICGIFKAPRPDRKFDELKTAATLITAAQKDEDAAAVNAVARLYTLKNELDVLYRASLSTTALVTEDFLDTYMNYFNPFNGSFLVATYGTAEEWDAVWMNASELNDGVASYLLDGKKPGEDTLLVSRNGLYQIIDLYNNRGVLPEGVFDRLYEIADNAKNEGLLDALRLIEETVPGALDELKVRHSEKEGAYRTVKVIGVVSEETTYADALLPSPAFSKFFSTGDKHYDAASADFLLTVNSDEARRALTGDAVAENDAESRRFMLHNNYQNDTLDRYARIVATASGVFFWAGIVFAAFAALLLFNFISVSINFKKRDIGILRALGARKVDVFKVFYSESMMIISACYLLSVIFSIILSVRFGVFLRNELLVSATLFFFGPLQALILGALAAAVAFISTVLPVYHHSKKPPVDAIRSL